MMKLFFFRSHSSNNFNRNQLSPPSTDKQEKPTEKVEKSVINKHTSEDQEFGNSPCLRRSLSFSSGSLYYTEKGLGKKGSPCDATYYSNKQSAHHSARPCALTPEKQTRSKGVDRVISRTNSDLLENSSLCSSNVSNKALDQYIDGDGEQQMEWCEPKTNFLIKNQSEDGNGLVKRPPKFPLTAHVSNDHRIQKPKSQSFRETKLSSRDSDDNGYCNESPRKLAQHVVERLSKSQSFPKMRSKESDSDSPITVDDVYGRNLNRCIMNWHTETNEGMSEFTEKFSEDKFMAGGEYTDTLTDTDVELVKQFKVAEDRAAILSEEFEKGNFAEFRELSVPTLIQKIRSLTEEKVNMALEVSAILEDRIAEKVLFREKLKLGREESQTRKLEKENNELQSTLKRELDRRSTEWSHKLEKLQAEERRLTERVRELEEQNVCLQREVSSSSEREMDSKTKITLSENQLRNLCNQVKKATEENQYLQKSLSEMQEKSRSAEEDSDCIRRKYEEKVTECKAMHQSISRLQRTCSDQGKTIGGLRGLLEELGKKISQENLDFEFVKLSLEHTRLLGVEQNIRKEVEQYRVEVDLLRRENIDLLNRLKNSGKEGSFSTYKLDSELQNRVSLLQSQMLPLLIESNQLGRKLIEYVKVNGGFSLKKRHASASCLDGQVLVECEVKLQGLERAAESLTTSIQTVSTVLQEKSMLLLDSQATRLCDESHDQKQEDIIRTELKAETLLTRLLREKLYSKEIYMEQMQAELAAAVRDNEVLKCEVQNAEDNFSCIKHKMKELDLHMMKKDEMVNQLQGDLQDCKKELAIVRGTLPRLSQERDSMWEKVKQLSEEKMLLNGENDTLKKKVEMLDEDILLKEGQITILKESISKPFDFLDSLDGNGKFCWSTK